MGFNIKNNYGPNIEVNDGGKVTLVQGQNGLWHTMEAEEAEVVEEVEETAPTESVCQLNYNAPTINLQRLLKHEWFRELRTSGQYDETWTDDLISNLMKTQWKEKIAQDWTVKGEREKKNQIRGYILGLLKDAGVLNGSYNSIAERTGIMDDSRTFSKYMGEGKKQPYSDWIISYVTGVIEA